MSNGMSRELYIRRTDGSCFIINIPLVATITYGNLHPGSKTGFNVTGHNDDKYVLRIYEGIGANKRQTAVIRGVDEFRDCSYDIVELPSQDVGFIPAEIGTQTLEIGQAVNVLADLAEDDVWTETWGDDQPEESQVAQTNW